ncbi:cytochrome b5 [Nadsonia fulvescens var. elongata DSM 6958]|uniref:Cytochrome b5 n=1 Tax=Nadsonia fulvescens var. elongata DSM 6958 TaxID=857566 RepID=A0A1E3PKS9_9ASCO|nr:cytochrome b5 [Nadsonia fulvescens var. elongata DSM 6958]
MSQKTYSPKVPVHIDPPKHDPFTLTELAQYDGVRSDKIYVSILSNIYDVTRSGSYNPGKNYHIFAGRESARALGKSSLKLEDVLRGDDLEGYTEKEHETLQGWVRFFEQRYNIVGRVKN